MTDRKKAEFNWPPERGATKISAKMEAILNFAPAGIYWTKRGVTFRYTVHKDGPGYHSKFSFIIRRKRIAQALREVSSGRYIVNNDAANWVWDGDSDIGDTQYPTNMKPNRAFSIDCPDHRIEEYVQITRSADFWETAHWHNGTEGEDGWSKITSDTNAKWYMNQTSVLPNGTKGGTNTHGPGPATAAAVFNTQPVANAGPNQAVAKGAAVTLTGAASSDADHDVVTYIWTQTAGPNVTLSGGTTVSPTFTAPNEAGQLTFSLKVTDITATLHHHKPTNSESTADTVTITVNP